MDDYIGKQLGNYRLVRLLGNGGFARVYLGEQIYLKTLAAIKVLPSQLDNKTTYKFLEEAQIIAKLEHTYIIKVLDFGVDTNNNINTPYLVMSYAPNGTLRQHCNNKKIIPPMQLWPMIKQIADALQYAHDNKVIHRDVKPENILLSQENNLLLSDFGLAIIMQSTLRSDKGGGTMLYSAPEQINGHATYASDQYSLAVLTYELLCGTRPFNGSYTELIGQHMHAIPRPLQDHNPLLHVAINDVVQKALAKRPERRFRNIIEFAEKLEEACKKRDAGSHTVMVRSLVSVHDDKIPSGVASPPQDSSVIWNVPYRRNLFFIGREQVLNELQMLFHANHSGSVTLALNGLGGAGKTQIAVEYTYRHHKDYRYILWVRGDKRDQLREDCHTIVAQVKPREKYERVTDTIKAWLRANTNWLLIVDNIDDLDLLRSFVPATARGHILLTTRKQATGQIAHGIDICQMTRDEATLLLLRRIKALPQDTSLAYALPSDLEKARELAATLGYLPLALDQAGAYIEETGCSMADYLALYPEHYVTLLDKRGGFLSDHPASVRATFLQSIEKIEHRNAIVADLLHFFAFLNPEQIPETLITDGAPEFSSTAQGLANEPLLLNGAIAELRKYSLIRRNTDDKMLSLHPLVQAVLKSRLNVQRQREWIERTIRAINRAFPDIEELQNWACCQQYMPHVQNCILLIERWNIVSAQAVRLLHQASIYLRIQAEYVEAERLHEQAVAMYTVVAATNDEELLPGYALRFWRYYRCRKYANVGSEMGKELEQIEQSLGTKHPYVATIRFNLAQLCYKLGKYSAAEQLFLQSLSIREQNVGLQHTCVACNFDGLGLIYLVRGRYDLAETNFQYALKIWEAVQTPKHPYIARSLNGLAQLSFSQGKYAKAEEYLRQEREMLAQVLPTHHPSLAYNLNDWATLCLAQGRYDQVEILLDQSQAHLDATVGLKHPIAARVFHTMARYQYVRSKYHRAESLLQRSLGISEQALGQQHPDVTATIYTLAEVYATEKYMAQGKRGLAEELHTQALKIREKVFGLSHPAVAQSLNGLGRLYFSWSKYELAEDYYQRAYAVYIHFFGEEHPDSAQALHDLAHLYANRKRYEEAEPLFKKVLASREKLLGPEHPDVGTTLKDYSLLLYSLKRSKEAKPYGARALKIREKYDRLNHTHEDDE